MKNNFYLTNKTLKKEINYYNHSNKLQILLYGNEANELINALSPRDINNIIDNSFYTFFLYKKKILDEVLIIKFSNIKYLIISNKVNVYTKLKKLKPKYNISTLIITKEYYIYSFHGNIDSLKSNNKLQPINRQGYNHLLYIEHKNKHFQIINFLSNFHELSIDNYNYFLYNNNVITSVNIKNKKMKLNIIKMLYSCDNINFYIKPVLLTIKKYESTLNFLPTKGSKIFNSSKKQIGFINQYYTVKNKRYPFIIAVIYKYRFSKTAYTIDKYSKNRIPIKYIPLYR